MKIDVTLLCHCCNTGATYGYQLQKALQNEGHEVSFHSRNSHGRGPGQMCLAVHFIPDELKETPLLIVTREGESPVCIKAADWAELVKKEESDAST